MEQEEAMELLSLVISNCNLTPLLRKGLIYKIDDSKEFSIENIRINKTTLGLQKIKQVKVEKKIDVNSSESWINEYRKLFTDINKEKGGKSGKAGVIMKMDKFILKTGYGKDIILAATVSYTQSLPISASSDSRVMSSADYFISYQSPSGEIKSQLEYWCEIVTTDPVENEPETKWG